MVLEREEFQQEMRSLETEYAISQLMQMRCQDSPYPGEESQDNRQQAQ